MKQNRYPVGWSEEKVRKLLLHYDSLSEDEAVAEDEAALRRRDQTVMVVPKKLVPLFTRIIAREGLEKRRSSRLPRQHPGSE